MATCRFYELSPERVMIGRVAVLAEYRGRHLGHRVIQETEQWIHELGYSTVEIESRTIALDFYRKLGYETVDGTIIQSGVFECIRMEKSL